MAGVSAARYSKELGSRPISTRPVATIGHDGQPGKNICQTIKYIMRAHALSQVHVLRVATSDNIADLPSRGEFNVLRAVQAGRNNTSKHLCRVACLFCQAIQMDPVVGLQQSEESCWHVLQERWQL